MDTRRIGNAALRTARRLGERALDDEQDEEPAVAAEPTFTQERQRVVRVACHRYAAQLLPWKVLAAAVAAGVYVDTQQWSPWGVLPWTFVFAIVAFLTTEWRLGGRHIKSGRIDWGNPRGRKQRGIRRRAIRSASMGAMVGVWLIAVTLTDPGRGGGHLVWLAGAGLWATCSHHGWWKPADTAPVQWLTGDEPGAELDDPTPVTAAPAATPGSPPLHRRPPRTAAQATTAAVVAEQDRMKVPDTSLLRKTVNAAVAAAANPDQTAVIEQVMAEFNLQGKVVEPQVGPTVTLYGIEPGPGQQADAFTRRKHDFALRLGTKKIAMHAPIEGRPLIGIEVPNVNRTFVTAGEVLESDVARRDPHPLVVALGTGPNGQYLAYNLRKAPHILLGGATQAGKSSCLNSMLVSLLTRATPDEVKLLLIDPKRVELTRYEDVPHLLTPVVTEPERAVGALEWVVAEMRLRYQDMQAAGVRDIDDLNDKIVSGEHAAPRGSNRVLGPYPYIVVVIDELADLVMTAKEEVEESVILIGQIARACGIHLVLATQDPRVDIVTGLIKANVPGRIGFTTTSLSASRVILDEGGAEKLTGRGDAIVKLPDLGTMRIQGCLVEDDEVEAVVGAWRTEVATKGVSVPQIKLATTVSDDGDTNRRRATAYETVMSAAIRLAGHDRKVTKDQIIEATLNVGASARNNALTRLFDEGILGKVDGQQAVYVVLSTGTDDQIDDDLLSQAVELVVTSQFGSTAMLQRKLRVGLAKAGQLMDLMEQYEIVGPSEGSKARDVLITPDRLHEALAGLRPNDNPPNQKAGEPL